MCGGGNKVDEMGGEDKTEDSGDGEKKEKKYMGEPRKYDPNFKGPIKNRSCTDIICCLLFLFFILGMIACSAIGYARGNPIKLIYPTDSSGKVCGLDYTDKPNVVYFDLLQCAKMGSAVIISGCPTPQVCVASCPSTYFTYLVGYATETGGGGGTATAERSKMLCKYSVDATDSGTNPNIKTLVDNEDCASYYIPTTPIVGRCIPSIFLQITDYAATLADGGQPLQSPTGENITGTLLNDASSYLAQFMSATEVVELIFKDIVASWWLLLVFLGVAMIVCFIWIILLRWIAGIIVWFSIFAVLAIMGYATYYCYAQYYTLKSQNVTADYGVSQAFALNFNYYLGLKDTWLAFGCTTATFLAIFLLILLFLCYRIRIAIELIKEGSRAIGNMIFTLFWPIWPFVLQVGVIGYFGVSIAYIATIGESQFYTNSTNTTQDNINYYLERTPCTPDNTTVGNFCDFVKYGGTEYIIPINVFMLFMFFWLMNFVVAFGQIVLAGAFASYYWAFEKPKDIPAFPLSASVWRAIRYHLGSLAFGSLIIAIIKMIRVALEYIDHKLKDSENPVSKFILKCLKCFFWCLEKFMKFLNRNAYILIAVYGKNFCTSAKDAFFLILRNVVRAVVLDKITDFVLFLSKLLVTAAVGAGAYYWFSQKISLFASYQPTLNYYITPIVIVIIGTYLITCCFFSVYTMAVDTLFLCFLEDLEKHDGTPEKPYFMSKGLMQILGKKNKFKEPDGKK